MEPFDNRQELIRIFRKYLDGTATPEEKLFVETWYQSFEKGTDVIDRYSETEQFLIESRMEQVLRKHTENSPNLFVEKKPTRRLVLRLVAAAAVLIVALAGGWRYLTTGYYPNEHSMASITTGKDLQPGRDKAVLTLSNGMQIALDRVSTGMLARQGSTVIHKVEEGLISYTGQGSPSSQGMNTITAPTGGKYRVVLPDGSKVWLNAESSISFPTAFSENERPVKISGEVFFDIAKDNLRPFVVQVGARQKVRVLGTQFNVNAYRDEGDITTTLLEGSVEILASTGSTKPIMLKPGEQASLSGTGKVLVKENINTEEIVAWKNGLFHFTNADIETVMRQLSRWYNVDVIYEGTVSNEFFSGKIGRQVSASEALEILRFTTGLHFRIESFPDSKRGRITVVSSEKKPSKSTRTKPLTTYEKT